jgi:hypothetical protein
MTTHWIAAAAALLYGCSQAGSSDDAIRDDVADLRAEMRSVREDLRAVRAELRELRGHADAPSAAGETTGATAEAEASGAGESTAAPAAAAASKRPIAKAEAPPKQASVKISVESNPAGAKVYVGDKVIGRTPVLLERVPGSEEVSIRIEKDGYRTRLLSVRPEEDTKLSVQLAKK